MKRRKPGTWLRILGVISLIVVACLVSTFTDGRSTAFAEEQPGKTITEEFSFDYPCTRIIEVDGSSFTSLMVPGALNIAQNEGEPALPVKFVQIVLPLDREVESITVTGTKEACNLEGLDLVANPIFPYQNSIPFNSPQPALVMDHQVYGSSNEFPVADYANPKVGYCKGYSIFSIALHPVKYHPSSGELYWYSKMSLTLQLNYKKATNQFLRTNKQKDKDWIENLVVNPEDTNSYKFSTSRANYPGGLCDPADDYDYVIITTRTNGLDYWPVSAGIPYNWDSLMDKHSLVQGLKCTLVTMQDITACTDYHDPDPLFNDTPARIREFCKDAYMDWGVDYILIGGDDEWIPAREMDAINTEEDVDSDIYWNHLDNNFNDDGDNYWGEAGDDGFDPYADLYIGRITCDTPQDVSNWLTKCFYYIDSTDRSYLEQATFYGGDTGWNCQGDDFIDYSAIQGLSKWLGPNPGADPYPSWLGFQYGFETWNQENPSIEYDLAIKWTAESPNQGWTGGSTSSAISGLRNAISNDTCTLISGIAHANANMSLDVSYSSWEADYHNTKPFFLHDFGCHCGDMDAAADGVLHSMLMHSDTELAFACVYNTGYGWGNFDNTCSSSSVQQKSFWDYLFDMANNSGNTDNWQMGRAQAYSKDTMAPTLDYNDGTWRSVIQGCLLFGDPAMRIKPPEEPALFMTFPTKLPTDLQPPGLKYVIDVKIEPGKETYLTGTAFMNYRLDPQSAYTQVAMTHMGGNDFQVEIPNTSPGDKPEFYFEAQGSGGSTVMLPYDAPNTTYSFDVGFKFILWSDDFETDKGWTVNNISISTGAWERADPTGTSAQPGDDHTASGVLCYVTGKDGGSSGNDDVDGGPTYLISPTLDCSIGDCEISCWLYFYHSSNGQFQPMEVSLSNDNGATWTKIESIAHIGDWVNKVYKVSNYLTPTSQMKIRYMATDNPNDSVVEGLVDDIEINFLDMNPSLYADCYNLSVAQGGIINLSLDTGAGYANRKYLLLGSISGISPGFTLPGGKVLPLNWDIFTSMILENLGSPIFQNFYGKLDGAGCSNAIMDSFGPIPSFMAGAEANFAYLLSGWDFTSNFITVKFAQ